MDRVPMFPQFRFLKDSDKSLIEPFIQAFPCYSDFNFISLFNYNTKGQTKIATLYDNLVVLSLDYISSTPFLSFIGQHKIKHMLPMLFEFAAQSGITPVLKLIPEHCLRNRAELESSYQITQDPDNHDYILSTEDAMCIKGESYRSKRRQIQKFCNTYPSHTIEFRSSHNDHLPKEQILEVFRMWEHAQNKDIKDSEVEFNAVQRMLTLHKKVDYHFIGLYIGKDLIGFSFFQILPDHHGMIHFQKSNYEFYGSFTYLTQQAAAHLWNYDCHYINIQQDLGIEGMKLSKQLWHPVKMLKKYTISLKH